MAFSMNSGLLGGGRGRNPGRGKSIDGFVEPRKYSAANQAIEKRPRVSCLFGHRGTRQFVGSESPWPVLRVGRSDACAQQVARSAADRQAVAPAAEVARVDLGGVQISQMAKSQLVDLRGQRRGVEEEMERLTRGGHAAGQSIQRELFPRAERVPRHGVIEHHAARRRQPGDE